MSSRIQAEIKSFTSNQSIRKMLMNFYRCSKTITLLNNLFYSSTINQKVYQQQVQEILVNYNVLKEGLKAYDLKRFCELWEIDYHQKVLIDLFQEDKVPRYIIWIANNLPRVNDEMSNGETYGEIYETFTLFCREIQKMKSASNVRQALRTVIDDFLDIQKNMQARYKNPTDSLDPQQRELILANINKFKVEFYIEYRLQ